VESSLELEKSTDLVVLEENFKILGTQISEILPVETWFEGRQVYRRQSSN
jgi:predicted amidohydrolase YtcJ